MPKKSVAGLISDSLKEHHVTKTVVQVLNKMCYLEDKYKDDKDFLHATGEGLSTEDEKMAISSIREKVYQKCLFYDITNPIMKDSVSISPPYVGESGSAENISDMLFNDLTLRGDFETVEDENNADEDGPEDEVTADAGEEFEEDDTPLTQRIAAGGSSQQPAQSSLENPQVPAN